MLTRLAWISFFVGFLNSVWNICGISIPKCLFIGPCKDHKLKEKTWGATWGTNLKAKNNVTYCYTICWLILEWRQVILDLVLLGNGNKLGGSIESEYKDANPNFDQVLTAKELKEKEDHTTFKEALASKEKYKAEKETDEMKKYRD